MKTITEDLKILTSEIKVLLIGLGAMGKGLLYQTLITPGIKCVAVYDKDTDKTKKY